MNVISLPQPGIKVFMTKYQIQDHYEKGKGVDVNHPSKYKDDTARRGHFPLPF